MALSADNWPTVPLCWHHLCPQAPLMLPDINITVPQGPNCRTYKGLRAELGLQDDSAQDERFLSP